MSTIGTRLFRPAPGHAPGGIILLSFCVFVFSVPFKELASGLGEDLSISKLTGYLLMLAAITRPRICLSRPPGAFWWFALYLLSYGLLTIPLEEKYQALAIGRIFSFAQLFVLFWISHNLLHHERVLDGFLRRSSPVPQPWLPSN